MPDDIFDVDDLTLLFLLVLMIDQYTKLFKKI